MEFIKNLVVLVFSTIVWAAGILVVASIWWGIKEQDMWYAIPLVISLVIIATAFIFSKYSPRLQAALEFPFGILHL